MSGFLKPCNYTIEQDWDSHLVIKDVGPWDHYMTVTNGAEWVVEELVELGKLPKEKRLFYYDSEGSLDEIVVKDGKFAGFKPGPKQLPK